MRILAVLALAACSSGSELTILPASDIHLALPAHTRGDEPATRKLFQAIEGTGHMRWVYRHCVHSALVLTVPNVERDQLIAGWAREAGWEHSIHKGLTDDVTRRARDGSFVELLVMPTIDRVDGAELDPIEQDLVLTYPSDLVVIALAGRCEST